MRESLRLGRWPTFLGALVLGICSISVAGDCTADLEINLSHKSQDGPVTHLEFSVEVRVPEECARVHYDVIVEELLPNEQTKRVRIPRVLDISDGAETDIVEHATELELLSYEVKLVSCDECELGV